MKNNYYRNQADSLAFVPWIIFSVLILGLAVFLGVKFDVFTKMQTVVYHNWFFWILIFGGVAYAFARWFLDPEKFAWFEIPIQIGASALLLWLLCSLFFFYGSDVRDKEIWNGYVVSAEYQEPHDYTQSHRHCTKIGEIEHCSTTYTCETTSAGYEDYNSFGQSSSISGGLYETYKQRWGNQEHVGSQGNHCAGHQGNIWRTTYRGPIEAMVPVSDERDYVNYLKASDAIRQKSADAARFEKYLIDYPTVHGGPFGNVEVDRALLIGFDDVKIDLIVGYDNGKDVMVDFLKYWQSELDGKLDRALGTLGDEKGVNILVYVVPVGRDDRKAFFSALNDHWAGGKRNDVIVVIGAPYFSEIVWVEVMAWTHVEAFKSALMNRVLESNALSRKSDLADVIVYQISRDAKDGGYEGMDMDEYAVLASEVSVAWWAQIIIFLIYAGMCYFVSLALVNNQLQNFMAKGNESVGKLFGVEKIKALFKKNK